MSEKKKRLFICRDDLTLGELGCSAVVTRDALKLMSERCFLVLTHRESLIVLGDNKDNTRRETRVGND